MIDASSDFLALCTTISSIYDLRGIGVSAVYVSREMMDWMKERNATGNRNPWCQSYEEAEVVFGITKTGNERVTMKPYGAERPLPVKVKYSGENPWKIVVTYRREK